MTELERIKIELAYWEARNDEICDEIERRTGVSFRNIPLCAVNPNGRDSTSA